MRKRIKSFRHALRGYKAAFKSDINFRLEIFGGLFFVVFGYIMWPLASYELLFLGLSYALILISELINSALETSLNKLHPIRHHMIGASKDMAAAAVVTSGLFALLVMGTIVLTRL